MSSKIQHKFENFLNVYHRLESVIASKQKDELTELERAGVLQLFEITFELSWKLMQEFLREQGYVVSGPRESIKKSFEHGLIENAGIWLEALTDRNLSTHVYSEEEVNAIVDRIYATYLGMFSELLNQLKQYEE